MDFFQVTTREIEKGPKKGQFEIYPDFIVGRSTDLMVRGRAFYAIYDNDSGLWSRDEYDVQRLVDHELQEFAKKNPAVTTVKTMRSFGSNGWNQFRKFVSQISDNAHDLDDNLTFSNTEVKKTDYVSHRLPYHLASGDHSAWDELVGTLYSSEERAKIEWAIGAVISGDSKKIQKFLVFYGPAGTGKSTILNIIQKLFDGYTTTFEAKALGSNNNAFSTEAFAGNPLVAIQHDGDLSNISDNTKLNSIVSHEPMSMNAKYKATYTANVKAFLLMGTNQPVRISDAKSGLIRRLIDVNPTGLKFQPNHYHALMSRIDFELGAIAHHCLEVYRKMGKNYYNTYRPLEMMFQTDIFFNFIEAHFDLFKSQNGTSLRQAYDLYTKWCEDTGIDPRHRLPQYKMRGELENYFEKFLDRTTIDGHTVRSYFSGFTAQPFKAPTKEDAKAFSLVLDETTSLLDLELADQPAQLAKEDGTPQQSWTMVKTTLADVDTSQVHYVKVPENHIVIDFDLKDDSGGRSLERNLEAASAWPPTYAELSKSGAGVHLHYIWTGGEQSDLSSNYADGIEVKVFPGSASLRRRLSRCNNVPIAEINTGLPLKEKKPMLHADQMKSERGLRDLIERNLRKEIHPGTKPSIDFIYKILEDAWLSPLQYDVSDLRPVVMAFANNSTNQALECLRIVNKMRWKSEAPFEEGAPWDEPAKDDRLVFFDVEVYPNLFVVCWKYEGSDTVVRMINPTSQQVEALFQYKLVGFNNRRYDNHILYAAYLGYDNEGLYKLSQKIIDGVVGSMFGEAYNLSYTDIFDFSSVKQGLKKFQIALGLHHKELDFPWDQPVAETDWARVVEYCVNDVITTEKVFESRRQDFNARLILSELSGLTPNDTTQKHAARFIFGDDKNPPRSFIYTKLAKEFPGYEYEKGVSTYRGENPSEGGYVYAEPGIYENVALLDVASMHPTSIRELNLFGDVYTQNFWELVRARLAIKGKRYEEVRGLLSGRLGKYLGTDETSTRGLSDALKIVINIVYGLTSAKFDNPFRDVRNIDNIVAKRGALFMIDLKHFVQEQGFTVAHIKTDSIKIPNATPEIIQAVMDFGKMYGYEFEYNPEKDFYDKFCLVNDAVYIARHDVCNAPIWTAVGAQFQHPYVFKSLFDTNNPIDFDDYCETKQVSQGAMYLDFESSKPMAWADIQGKPHFVGRTGRFVPVKEGFGGGILLRVKDGKSYAVAGTKGYLWLEADNAKALGMDAIDMDYFEGLAADAKKTIEKFGDFEEFIR